jgi:hypothetical protein
MSAHKDVWLNHKRIDFYNGFQKYNNFLLKFNTLQAYK